MNKVYTFLFMVPAWVASNIEVNCQLSTYRAYAFVSQNLDEYLRSRGPLPQSVRNPRSPPAAHRLAILRLCHHFDIVLAA